MADFYQTGVLATLHRLGGRPLQSLEKDLCEFTKVQPIALVLPALYPEFEGSAMPQILQEVSQVPYLNQVVVTLGGADAHQFDEAKRRVAGIHPRTRVIWNDGPRIQENYRDLEAAGLSVGADGKGRSCWLAYGYVLAGGRSKIIALHDCDIVNYSREILARLCYPVADVRIDFLFSKGYYARVSDRMYGRATRLLLTPLVRSLERVVGHHPFLVYLDSFRYPLAGEMCMYADMARVNRIPGDWGLEVGMLSEVYRNFSLNRLCQVDIADNYEHKHQTLSADDPNKGLLRMTVDIAKTLFRTLAAEGVLLSEGLFRSLQAQYIRTAEDTIVSYHADATLNGLAFDRHAEEEAVHAFGRGLRLAAESYLADPLGAPLIPNWNRVVAAVPDAFTRLDEAVEADNT
jgi:glucosyl-3-phosphoglycerate synthase